MRSSGSSPTCCIGGASLSPRRFLCSWMREATVHEETHGGVNRCVKKPPAIRRLVGGGAGRAPRGSLQALHRFGFETFYQGPHQAYSAASDVPRMRPMLNALELEQWRTKLRLYMKRCAISPMAYKPSMGASLSSTTRQSASVFTPPMVAT